MRWACGLTTVPQRRDDLLPRTLASISAAGFPKPRLFIDGARNAEAAWWEDRFGCEVTARHPAVRTFGNWALSLAEVYLRDPQADRFAVFQDDFITYRNLRRYLEQCQYPPEGYWNLYTFPVSQRCFPRVGKTARFVEGWRQSHQRGLGAVALVFDRPTVVKLLTHVDIVERPADVGRTERQKRDRPWWKAVDGAVVTVLKKQGLREYVHNPSLVQHTGERSTMGNGRHARASSFRGEDYDALEMLGEKPTQPKAVQTVDRDEWQRELNALERAIADDRQRLTAAGRANDRQGIREFSRKITEYSRKLEEHKKMRVS